MKSTAPLLSKIQVEIWPKLFKFLFLERNISANHSFLFWQEIIERDLALNGDKFLVPI
jgi:hypothetical protein